VSDFDPNTSQVENLTLTHTSASYFLPHEETSGGDYAIARSAAIVAENATGIVVRTRFCFCFCFCLVG
jgi:hypothetical protein